MITRKLAELPKPYLIYPKVIKSMVYNPAKGKKDLPEVEYTVEGIKVDPKHLAKYEKVCGFRPSDLVPATYLQVLAQALQMSMMTSEPFPFPIIGLVHIRDMVTQYRPVNVSETLTIKTRFGKLTPHEKGVQFDFINEFYGTSGENVVSGVTTYLIRQKTDSNAKKAPIEIIARPEPTLQNQWKIPENIGRKYGAVSGDFNLIHIHKLTAKLFGFTSSIAHGMWTDGRCMAELANNDMIPPSYKAVVNFKLPVFIPATVTFSAWQKNDQVKFALNDSKSGKPHLDGELKAI